MRRFTRKAHRGKARGGRYIGRGTFGCTFRPAVRCKTNKSRESNAISKIMLSRNADDEYKIGPILAKIDPEQIFTLYPYKICEPELNSINLTDECNNILSKHDKKAIFLKDGGENLSDVLGKLPKGAIDKGHRNLFRALKNLFVGLEHLHNNNFVHLDIKTKNIVCKITSGNEMRFLGFYIGGKPVYIMKFIDFGMSGMTDNAMKAQNLFEYIMWPFELRLVKNNYLFGFEELSKADIDRYYKTVRGNPIQLYAPYWLLSNTSETPSLDFYNAIHAYTKSLSYEGKLEARRDILKKADVYSLGIVLSNCYYTLTSIRKTGPNSYVNSAQGSKQHDEVTVPLFELVDKMTNPDYRLRLTSKDARIEYERVLLGIEAQFGK
jgi:serine/threonine protein kinase